MSIIRYIFLFAVLCVAFVVGRIVYGWILQDKDHLSFSKIIITGNRRYTHNSDICQIIQVVNTSSVFLIRDVNVVQKQILHLPWIKHVSVKKYWPNVLRVHIVEYIPIAYWNDRQHVTDVDGHLFSIPLERINQQDLPLVYAPEGSRKEVLQKYCDIVRILARNQFTLVLKEVFMTSRHSWYLTLMNGIKLNLGCGDITKSLTCFLTLYPILIKQSQSNGKLINYIDLRYKSGAAVSWLPLVIKETKQQNQAEMQAK